MRDGRVLHQVRPVTVSAAKYKTSRLTVPQKYVTPDPETLKRIEAEKEIKNAAFAHFISVPEWSGNFVAPVSTEVSETFGTSRTFNGKLASVHRGTGLSRAHGHSRCTPPMPAKWCWRASCFTRAIAWSSITAWDS